MGLADGQAWERDYPAPEKADPHPGHTLYTAKDFTGEEVERSSLARMVVEGGLGICKKCGAGEADLDEFPTCREYNGYLRAIRQEEQRKRRGAYPK
jgi:hypothetical protein